MDIVNLCCYGSGYHSGATYEENIALSKEAFEKCSDEVGDLKICLGELDGKHSCVYGDIEVQHFLEEDIPGAGFENTDNDGDALYCELKTVLGKCGIDLDIEIARVNEYIQSLDLIVDVTVKAKMSDADKVRAYAQSLL